MPARALSRIRPGADSDARNFPQSRQAHGFVNLKQAARKIRLTAVVLRRKVQDSSSRRVSLGRSRNNSSIDSSAAARAIRSEGAWSSTEKSGASPAAIACSRSSRAQNP